MRIAPYYVSFSLPLSLSHTLFLSFFFPSFFNLPIFFEIVPQLSPSSSILLPSSASPPVPDLFFFCLNLVAIRSGHTPRQGRVRSPRPDLEEVQQRAARVHVRKGGGSVRARTHIRRFLPSTAPITIHRRGSLFSYSEIIAVPWILVNDRPRNFSFRPGPGDICPRQFRLTFTTVATPRKLNKHADRQTN